MTTTADHRHAETAPLSARLREATAAQHSRAEGTAFVTALMRGRAPRESYRDLARQHIEIYRALEQAGEHLCDEPVLRGLLHRSLLRTPALEADLRHLAGPSWESELPVMPATHRYRERLQRWAGTWTGYYLAHAYTRYLGDLSGGQVVATMLQRHYAFTEDEVQFYRSPEIPRLKPFKDEYRAAMDAADFTPDEVDRIGRECQVAFDLNTAVFMDLATFHGIAASDATDP